MWNKREETGAPRIQPDPAPPAAVPVPPPAAASPSNIAVIGASMAVRGEIRSREELLVEGDVEGTIESQSSMTIGPSGKVKANIRAREITIYGSVRGNIEATERISIRDNGSMIGDIKTVGISIDDGAYFKGSIDIVRPEPARPPQAAVAGQPVAVGD